MGAALGNGVFLTALLLMVDVDLTPEACCKAAAFYTGAPSSCCDQRKDDKNTTLVSPGHFTCCVFSHVEHATVRGGVQLT